MVPAASTSAPNLNRRQAPRGLFHPVGELDPRTARFLGSSTVVTDVIRQTPSRISR